MKTFKSPYGLGDRVFVGPGQDLIATVSAVLWSANEAQLKVTYVHCGIVYAPWVDLSIVSAVPSADSTTSAAAKLTADLSGKKELSNG